MAFSSNATKCQPWEEEQNGSNQQEIISKRRPRIRISFGETDLGSLSHGVAVRGRCGEERNCEKSMCLFRALLSFEAVPVMGVHVISIALEAKSSLVLMASPRLGEAISKRKSLPIARLPSRINIGERMWPYCDMGEYKFYLLIRMGRHERR